MLSALNSTWFVSFLSCFIHPVDHTFDPSIARKQNHLTRSLTRPIIQIGYETMQLFAHAVVLSKRKNEWLGMIHAIQVLVRRAIRHL
jgi:hypothetical protein